MVSEQNPYDAPTLETNASTSQAEGSYAHLYAKVGKFLGLIVGLISGVYIAGGGILHVLSEVNAGPNVPESILISVVLGLVTFALVTGVARLLLMGVGFAIGFLVDVATRR